MSRNNSPSEQIIDEIVGRVLAAPITIPLGMAGAIVRSAGKAGAKGVGAAGDVGVATRQATTNTLGLTKTPAEQQQAQKAKREKLITKTLKKDPAKAEKMRQAIEPKKTTNMESLKTHLDGNFELFVENILDETKLKPANTPQGKFQRADSAKREAEQQGKSDAEQRRIVANRAKERQQGTPAATMQAKKVLRPLKARDVRKATAGITGRATQRVGQAEASAKAAKQKAGQAAAEKIGKAREEAAQAKAESQRKRAQTHKTTEKARARAEKQSQQAQKEAQRAQRAAQAEQAQTRKERVKNVKRYQKAKARYTGKKDAFFRRNRPEYKEAIRKSEKEITIAKAEAKQAPKLAKIRAKGERKAAMARLKGTEGGMIRRGIRKALGREEKFQRRLAQYGSEGYGGGVAARQAASEKAEQRKEARKRASEKIVGESKRGKLDSLIREGATRR